MSRIRESLNALTFAGLALALSSFAVGAETGKRLSTDYSVSVGGKTVEVVRTPKPENHIPKGLQFSYSYAHFAATGTVEVTVRSDALWMRRTRILPDSKRIDRIGSDDRTVTFRMTPPCTVAVEPMGRHRALILSADLPDVRPVEANGRKVRAFGPGYHRPGLISLGDNETLYLEAGAWVEGYVVGKGDNMTVCGQGVLSGAPWNWGAEPEGSWKGRFVYLQGNGLQVRDVTLFSSWMWTLHLNCVTNGLVENVKVLGGRVINDDGMDLGRVKNVVVRNSFVRCQDDCLTPKWWCDGIVCSNCTLWTEMANAIRLGYECERKDTGHAYRNVLMRDIDILHLSLVPTRPSEYWANAAICLQPCNTQEFEAFAFERIRFGEANPWDNFLVVKAMPVTVGHDFPEVGDFRGLTLRDISLPESHGGMGVYMDAPDPRHVIEGVRFENVTGYGEVVRKGNVRKVDLRQPAETATKQTP